MIDEVKSKVKTLLESGDINGVLGLRSIHSHVQPFLFTKEEELEDLVLNPKYSLSKIVKLLQREYPEQKIGVVARGCDEKALIELAKRNHVVLDKIHIIGVACTEEEAKDCACKTPYPQKIDVGKKVNGIDSNELAENLKKKSLKERFDFWMRMFQRCMKCYGCRDACPVCNCDFCMLEKHEWVGGGALPPEHPTFHYIRIYHMTEKCVGCGECEKACPVEIPLASLQKILREDVFELFDYVTGLDVNDKSPLISTLEDVPLKEEEK
jgi:formate dehydrogenase subunit beta